MKKRLLLIFIVGISFSPSVFADLNTGVGPFNKATNGGEIYCSVLHQWVKSDNNAAGTNQSAPAAGEAKSGSMTFQSNASQGNNS